MKEWLSLFSASLFLSSLCFGALNKTYPTAATTQIRMDVYTDVFKTIYNSTITDAGVDIINMIADNDVEQYMVLPSTYAYGGWKGWCLNVVNGHNVPISCP